MRPFDLIKATVVCGMIAYLAFSFPAFSQGLIIAILSLLWLSYFHRTIVTARAR